MHDERASLTAVAVSLLRGVAPHPASPRAVVDPWADRALPWAAGLAVRLLRPVVWAPGVELVWRYAWLGLSSHVVFRTLAIDAALADALATGCRQVLVLGAGFDTRALRLDALAGVLVWEVDHPATQASKRASLPDSPARYVAVDFVRDDLRERLLEAGFDASIPAAVIWEGVTPYLPPEAIDASLGALRELLAPASRLLVTFGVPELTSLMQGRLAATHRFFQRLGEPLLGVQPEAAFHKRLRAHGFEPLQTSGCADWAAALNRPAPRNIIGERLVVALRTDNPTVQ